MVGWGSASGVLGVLPGIVGSIQAMETLKLLLGLGEQRPKGEAASAYVRRLRTKVEGAGSGFGFGK